MQSGKEICACVRDRTGLASAQLTRGLVEWQDKDAWKCNILKKVKKWLGGKGG